MPPVIILKFDDVAPRAGDIPQNWRSLAAYLESNGIAAGFGVVSEGFRHASLPSAVAQWFADRQASGLIEFWCHGWDHDAHQENGEWHCEFHSRPEELVRRRLARCNEVARAVFGRAYRTFGPTGHARAHDSGFDAASLAAVAADPDLQIVLYNRPMDEDARAVSGRLAILDRVWEVNTESHVGYPDFARFEEGYAKHAAAREYFVLQGHPGVWDERGFADFERIVDFLRARDAKFMTPSDYVDFRSPS